ncbi:MAG: hypothetical protein ACRYG8_08060 [Janthinobacterium lividum]
MDFVSMAFWRRVAPCIALASLITPAAAADTNSIPPGAYHLPTTPVNRSLPDLLTDGYDIVNLTDGLGGAVLLLKRQKSWLLCTLGAAEDGAAAGYYTKCEALSHG